MSQAQVGILSDGVVSTAEVNWVLSEERLCLEDTWADVTADPLGGLGWEIHFGPDFAGDPDQFVERCGTKSRPTVGVYIFQHQPSEDEKLALRYGVIDCLDKLGITVPDRPESALTEELATQADLSSRRTGTPEEQAVADKAMECFGPWQAGSVTPVPGVDIALKEWLKSG